MKSDSIKKMNKKITAYLVIICCILTLKSMAVSSYFVICEFESESNIEMLHTQKIAHNHTEDTDFDHHSEYHNSYSNDLSDEYQYSECVPCSDTHIYYEVQVFQKRASSEKDFSLCRCVVTKIDNTTQITEHGIFNNTDIILTAYNPTITILRI